MNKADIEIAVLEEAIQNIKSISNASVFELMEPFAQLLMQKGLQLAISELENMIDETRDET